MKTLFVGRWREARGGWTHVLIAYLVLAAAVGQPRWSQADEGGCPGLLARFARGIGDYWADLKATYGLRLFFRKAPENEVERRLLGFLTEYQPPPDQRWYSHPISRLLRFLPRAITRKIFGKPFDLTIVGGSYFNLLARPVRWVSGHIAQNKREPSLLVSLPLGFLLTAWLMSLGDDKNKKIDAEKIMVSIEEHAEEWDRIIREDPRFKDIREARDEGRMSPKDARGEAYLRNHFIAAYYEFMQSADGMEPAEVRKHLLANPVFFHISGVAEHGVPKVPGYRYPPGFSPKVSDEKIDALIEITHSLYASYPVIEALVKNPQQAAALENEPGSGEKVKEIVANIKADPFAQFLFKLRERGDISDTQLVYRLQEDLQWQVKFMEWETLGIQKLRKEGDRYTDAPLTLEDIRRETIEEMREEKGKPLKLAR